MSTQPAPEPTPTTPAPQQPTQPPTEDGNKSDRNGHVDQPITIRGRMR